MFKKASAKHSTQSSMPTPSAPSISMANNPPSYHQTMTQPQVYPQAPTGGQPSRFVTGATMNPSRFAQPISAAEKYGIPPDRLAILKGYDVLFLIDDSWTSISSSFD